MPSWPRSVCLLSALLLIFAGAMGCTRSRPKDTKLTLEERRAAGGTLYFVSERSGHSETWAISPDGSSERKVIDRTAFPAAVSPDGSALLLIEVQGPEESHTEQLLLQPLPDGPAVALSEPVARLRTPSWSADGKRIVFASSAKGFSDLYIINRDGTGLQQLTQDEHGSFEPTFSPDGQHLAFVSTRDGDPEVYRMRADGTEAQRLTAFHMEDTAPRWAPSADRIAFVSNRQGHDDLFVMAADGAFQTALTKGEGDKGGDLVWSPDGQRVLFVVRAPKQPARIFVADIEKKTTAALTPATTDAATPAWSPDGKLIAYSAGRGDDADLYLMREDGTGAIRLTTAQGAEWRPLWAKAASSPAVK